jgi:hypothetical protein
MQEMSGVVLSLSLYTHIRLTLNCQINGHLNFALSEVTCQNAENRENMKLAGNINISAGGNSVHLSLKPNCAQEKNIIGCVYF